MQNKKRKCKGRIIITNRITENYLSIFTIEREGGLIRQKSAKFYRQQKFRLMFMSKRQLQFSI